MRFTSLRPSADMDECALAAVSGLQACRPGEECRNSAGSFSCSCPEGYAASRDGRGCEGEALCPNPHRPPPTEGAPLRLLPLPPQTWTSAAWRSRAAASWGTCASTQRAASCAAASRASEPRPRPALVSLPSKKGASVGPLNLVGSDSALVFV